MSIWLVVIALGILGTIILWQVKSARDWSDLPPAERDRIIARGPKPAAEFRTGLAMPIREWLLKNLDDPRDLEIVECGEIEARKQYPEWWFQTVRFRAYNALGGRVLERHDFLINSQEVMLAYDYNLRLVEAEREKAMQLQRDRR